MSDVQNSHSTKHNLLVLRRGTANSIAAMDDIVLVTADSVRYDYIDSMEFLSSLSARLGITAGHYTRPSLASLLSSSLVASIQSRVVRPSLAEVLNDAGYTCIGLAPTPQADPSFAFDAGFDQYRNFIEGGGDNPVVNRRSSLREYLGQFDLVRRVYRRLVPMEAVLAGIPSDVDLIDCALEYFHDSTPPRFLWIHLMGSHRPYGTGEEAVPKSIDRKAGALGGQTLFSGGELSQDEHDLINRKYRNALSRVDRQVERLLGEFDTDPVFVFTSDHGEELGEDGFYYHQGYRRRVVDTLIQVPVVFDGINVSASRMSLLDIAPTIVESVDLNPPDSWDGNSLLETETDQVITVAPWHDRATVIWQDFEKKLVCRNANVSMEIDDRHIDMTRTMVDSDLERQLRDLGYMDAG